MASETVPADSRPRHDPASRPSARATTHSRPPAAIRSILRSTPFALAVLQLAIFVAVAALVAWLLYWQFNQMLTRQIVATLRAEAAGILALEQSASPAAVDDAITARARAVGPQLYVVLDATGEKRAGNLNRWPPELAGSTLGGVFRYGGDAAGAPAIRLAIGLPVALGDGRRALLARDIEEERAFAGHVSWLLTAGFAVLALTTLALGILSSRLMLRRIGDITRTTETIMAGDLGRRVPCSGTDDELDDLARRLNLMLDRIEQLMIGMREISDNIAHDLKTPLNRLRNRAEAALRDPAGASAHRQGLEATIDAADDIIKTFNALLLIARLEAGLPDESLDSFALDELVGDVVDLYQPVAEDAGLALVVAGDRLPPVMVTANRQLIGQAVANLIDNAIKYGRPVAANSAVAAARATIQIGLAGVSGCAILTVADHGSGIAAADRARVLDRFVRLDSSRSQPGTGLGLSLVSAVARLHGGTLELEDNRPGLRVRLSFPAAGPRRAA